MQSFLAQVVAHLHRQHGEQMSTITIVLPSQRAGLFAKALIGRQMGKTIWAPRVCTIHEFVEDLSDLEMLDGMTLLFELYATYQEVEGQDAESFERFGKWGQIMLNDFSEIDRYMLPTEQVYADLSDIKVIDNWSLSGEELTENQQNYLDFWRKLGTYYRHFAEKLLERNKAFQGLAFKQVAENIDALHQNMEGPIYFVGFNALSKAEETIIRAFVEAGKAEVFWDADTYYLNNHNHEAGLFLRRHKKNWNINPLPWEAEYLSKESKNINIIGVPQSVGQAKVAGDILQQIGGADYTNVALVLADETLLMPVLNSIPMQVEDVNVTMGYPLKNTPLHNLFELVFVLQENAQRLLRGGDDRKFYYKNILKIFHHPYIKSLLNTAEAGNFSETIIAIISAKNKVFIDFEEIKSYAEEQHRPLLDQMAFLFEKWQQIPDDALDCFVKLIEVLKDRFINDELLANKLELEYLYQYTTIVKKLQTLFGQYTFVNELKSFKAIFHQVVNAGSLSFFGEPLRGLQLMGMLETRVLDFETVILLSANENTIPKAKQDSTFIPFDLKRYYHLPTHIEKDAIYAYHFYRLIQRASNVYLLYNTENDDFGSGEKSRFITQLQHELPKINLNIKINEQVLATPVVQNESLPVPIAKNEQILEQLTQLYKSGLSPSALNTYINCPLDFYYKYILQLRETDEVEETIEARHMGSFVHQTLEEFYTPFIDKNVTAADLKAMLPRIEAEMMRQFEKKYSTEEINFGKNYLIFRVAVKFVDRFIRQEMVLLEETGTPLFIKFLEKKLRSTIHVPINGQPQEVVIKGEADRIDTLGNTIRIIDYKTGNATRSELNVRQLDAVTTDPKYSKSLQLLTYGLLYAKNFGNELALQSGIVSFRNLKEGVLSTRINQSETLNQETLQEFEELLQQLVQEIHNSEIPFQHNEESTYCKFCH